MRVADVMQKDVISVSPELSLRDFEALLTSSDISGALVLGSDGRAVGTASKTDIVRALGEEAPRQLAELLESDLTVADILSDRLISVGPEDDIHAVAKVMVDAHVSRVFVIEDNEIIGIVTTFDLLRVLAA